MIKKIQKLILIIGSESKKLDELLDDGWVITNISSHYCGDGRINKSRCYVLLEKCVYETD